MAYDVARVRGLHPTLGDGWVHLDPQAGMLIPDAVSTTVSTAFRTSGASAVGPHPLARRSATLLDAARQAVADMLLVELHFGRREALLDMAQPLGMPIAPGPAR